MAVSNQYVLHGISLPGGQFLSQITRDELPLGVQQIVARGAGDNSPQSAGMAYAAPTLNFTTQQIKTVLDLTGATACAPLAGNIDLYFRRATPQSTRDALASATGYRFRATVGHLYWSSIRATQGQLAEIEVSIVLVWDGVNAILSPAGSQVVAGTPSALQRYTLGPVKLNAAFVGGVTEMSLDSGATQEITGSDGDAHPTFAGQSAWNPVCAFKTLQMPVWTTFGVPVTTLTSFSAFLRALAVNDNPVAYATASHIGIGAVGGTIALDTVSSGGNNPASTGVRVTLTDATGLGSPITVNTATAIS